MASKKEFREGDGRIQWYIVRNRRNSLSLSRICTWCFMRTCSSTNLGLGELEVLNFDYEKSWSKGADTYVGYLLICPDNFCKWNLSQPPNNLV